MRLRNASFFVLFFLFACIHHSVPDSRAPNRTFPTQTAEVFVDQNGTFYPNNWQATYGGPRSRGAYALSTIAAQNGTLEQLRAAEKATQDALASFLADKQRVFVFIHGYNNDQAEARRAYDIMKTRIAFEPNDAVVEFFWDGLIGTGLGAGKIWFNAAGYSQLAGSKGLRTILNRLHDKDIVIITHSRGASVALSALSDPPYSPDFAADTRRYHRIEVHDQPPLENRSNRIRVIFLAPAVGLVDFRARDFPRDTSFRSLGPQVVQIEVTVNPADPVLRKWIGKGGVFNPTDLGLDPQVSGQLALHYPFLSSLALTNLPKHGFVSYVEHPGFLEILRRLGVRTR